MLYKMNRLHKIDYTLLHIIRAQMLIEDIQMVEINKIPVLEKYIDLHSLD